MTLQEAHEVALSDLRGAEARWRADRLGVVRRCEIYRAAGLPLPAILEALEISQASYYRRLSEYERVLGAAREHAEATP